MARDWPLSGTDRLTASLRKLSGSLDLNAAMPLGHAVRAEMPLRCVSFGVCVWRVLRLKLCFMERWTATADLSFTPQNCEMCHPAILPLSAISGLTTTLSHGKVEPLGLWGGFCHPQLEGLTLKLNTGRGFRAPTLPFGLPHGQLQAVAHRPTAGFRFAPTG